MSKQFFVRQGEKRKHSQSYSKPFQRSITKNGKDRM